jgi:hypothetical protein
LAYKYFRLACIIHNDALGGDLAYQYGKIGNLSGIGVNVVQSILADAAFGAGAQALKPLAGLQDGAVKLM